jgi:hypothetical protein
MTDEERLILRIKCWMRTHFYDVSYHGYQAWFEKVLEIEPTYFDGKEVIILD